MAADVGAEAPRCAPATAAAVAAALRLPALVGCSGVLLLFGGLGLRAAESPRWDDVMREQNDSIASALVKANVTDEQLEILRGWQLPSACSCADGVIAVPQPSPWDLPGACFFSLTAVTTVGYGNYSPRTNSGRLVTAVLTLVGMGLLGYTLAKIAEGMVGGLTGLAELCTRLARPPRLGPDGRLTDEAREHLREWFDSFDASKSNALTEDELAAFLAMLNDGVPAAQEDLRFVIARSDHRGTGAIEFDEFEAAVEAWYERNPIRPKHQAESHAALALVLCAVLFGIFSRLFMHVEGWPAKDAMWFSFVSMTTCGFGDLVPASSWGRALVYALTLLALSTLAYLISTLVDIVEMHMSRVSLREGLRRAAAMPVDTTGDGVHDTIFVDTTGDGKLDFAAPICANLSNSPHDQASPAQRSVSAAALAAPAAARPPPPWNSSGTSPPREAEGGALEPLLLGASGALRSPPARSEDTGRSPPSRASARRAAAPGIVPPAAVVRYTAGLSTSNFGPRRTYSFSRSVAGAQRTRSWQVAGGESSLAMSTSIAADVGHHPTLPVSPPRQSQGPPSSPAEAAALAAALRALRDAGLTDLDSAAALAAAVAPPGPPRRGVTTAW